MKSKNFLFAKGLIAIWLFIIGFLIGCYFVNAETLDYNQCKTFYQINQSSNQTIYYPVEVCAKEFPRINKNIVLDNDNPIFILPDYNFSVKISEKVYQEQMIQVLQNTKDIQDLNKKIDDLNSKVEGLNNYINQQIGNLNSQISNQTSSLSSQIIEIQNALRRPQGFGYEWIVVLIVFLGIIIAYFGLKSGMIKLPRYKAPEYETVEPSVIEKRKKLKKV
jgi:hypothetical protein